MRIRPLHLDLCAPMMAAGASKAFMWIEAILTEEDVAGLMSQLTPVRIALGTESSHGRFIHLGRPSSVKLVKDEGVRIVTCAKVQWTVSALRVPFTLLNLQLLLRPEIAGTATNKRGSLAFHLHIEEADLEHVPDVIDRGITKAVNAALAERPLAWDFATTLSKSLPLPRTLEPLDALALEASWGEVKTTDSALVFAISFQPTVVRAGAAHDEELVEAHDSSHA